MTSADGHAEQVTLMYREAAESGDACRRFLRHNRDALTSLGARLQTSPPASVVTLARGSSDNAATYGRYLIETRCGTLTSSAGLSVASIYGTPPAMEGNLAIAISQSGASPDLVASARAMRQRGALLIALVNEADSPLAREADIVLALSAGPERSVAATKSFIVSAAGLLAIAAAWSDDGALTSALEALPGDLDCAWQSDWKPALPILLDAASLYVVARGVGFGIAQEIALKIKETCGFHAEAFSAAEVRHGPMALVDSGFPVLLLGQNDEALGSVADLATLFETRGARIITAGLPVGSAGLALPAIEADPAIQPLLSALSFYRLANALSLARGRDPDRPPHLSKVTETL